MFNFPGHYTESRKVKLLLVSPIRQLNKNTLIFLCPGCGRPSRNFRRSLGKKPLLTQDTRKVKELLFIFPAATRTTWDTEKLTNTMARSNGRPRSGRIHVENRATDDAAPILGSDLVVGDDRAAEALLEDALHETISKGMTQQTRKNYRSRIERIIRYLDVNVPSYYAVGVRKITEEEKGDRSKYYFDRTEDLIYSGFNVKFFLFFLASEEVNKDGKLVGYDQLRKFRDAVLWGSKIAGQLLPSDFFTKSETYLIAFRRKFAQAKKVGNVEEQATDPIPIPVYRFLLRRSIETNNIFAWTWTLLQWNCMARSASIDCLGFHNFSLGTDSLVVKYDDSKADKAGEKLSEKNLYANPIDWTMCPWLGLGVYFCVNCGNLGENERLFLKHGRKEGISSTKYNEQMK